MLLGMAVLLGCWGAGELLVRMLGLVFPGNVAGLLILLAYALARRGIGQGTARSGGYLLSHMALLFVPAGVGLMEYGDLFAEQGMAMLAVLVLSTVVTILVTALTLKWLLALRRVER